MNLLTIEARFDSKRLPGKVLKELDSIPIIKIIYDKSKNLKFVDKSIVATTKSKKDDILCKFLYKNKIPFFRGSEDDVWLRLRECCYKYKADNLIKLTGDNPFIDHKIITEGFETFTEKSDVDILCVCDKRSIPIGLDFEILKTEPFTQSYKLDRDNYDKEHATTFLKRFYKKFDFFPKKLISKDLIKDIELTIDTKQDFEFARKILNLSNSNIFNLGINEIYNLYKKFDLKHNSIRKWNKGL